MEQDYKKYFKPLNIKKKYEKAEQFQSYYVNGALGGFTNKYDMRLAFYQVNTLDHMINSKKSESKLPLNEEEAIENLRKHPMPHDILCEVIMSKESAKELYFFLKKQFQQLEEIEKLIPPLKIPHLKKD